MMTWERGYLNPQLEYGPYATAYMNSIQSELGIPSSGIYASSKHYAMIEYMYGLSIDTANSSALTALGSGELSYIGQYIGFKWPSVYAADFANNIQFIPASSFPGPNPYIGFSSAASGITYGTFTSSNPIQVGVFASVSVYRVILKFIAAVKWNGFNIIQIDELLSSILDTLGYVVIGGYTITIGSPFSQTDIASKTDVYINFNFNTANIGVGYLYMLQLVFNKICTMPQVQLSIS